MWQVNEGLLAFQIYVCETENSIIHCFPIAAVLCGNVKGGRICMLLGACDGAFEKICCWVIERSH